MTPTERLVNVGVPITLKAIGDVRVRELTLEQIVTIAGDLAVVLKGLPSLADETADKEAAIAWLLEAVKRPEVLAALRQVAASTCGTTPTMFENIGISDWVKWLNAAKKAVDWEELRDLFSEMIPPGILTPSEPPMTSAT